MLWFNPAAGNQDLTAACSPLLRFPQQDGEEKGTAGKTWRLRQRQLSKKTK